MNWVIFSTSFMSWLSTRARRALSASSPCLKTTCAAVSQPLTGHIRPNSACTNKYLKVYLTSGGTGSGQPNTPARWLIATRPKSLQAMRSISR